MMNENPLEREKTIDEHSSNRFLTDSILSDVQTRGVMKEIASGSRKQNWEAKWRRAGKTPPSVITVDRITLENKLKEKMRPYQPGGLGGIKNVFPSMTQAEARVAKTNVDQKKTEMTEIAKLINQANAFGIDTIKYRQIMSQQLRECAAAEHAIKAVLGHA
jgi:hypothetical protein